MKVLGFGGRDYGMTIDTSGRHPVLRIKPEEIKVLFNKLDEIAEDGFDSITNQDTEPPNRITKLIAGCAPGADFLCAVWAASRGIPVDEFPADWKEKGSSAGPIRNQKMANQEPDLGVRFQGGNGSNNMHELLARQGIPVEWVL